MTENRVVKKTKEDWLEQGIKYLKAKRYKEALEACKTASQIDPTCPRAYHGMGIIFTQLKDYGNALKFYEHAHRLDPNNAKIAFDMGEFFFFLKNYRRAYIHYQEAVKLDRKYEHSYVKRVRSLNDIVWRINRHNLFENNDKAVERAYKNVLLLNPSHSQALAFFAKREEDRLKSEMPVPYERSNALEEISQVANQLHPFNCRCINCWEP